MNIKKYQIIGFIFTSILGVILHFLYEFSNKNLLVGYFSAVNESTWEHLKLLIVPIILFGILEYFLYGKDIDNFIIIKALSILIGILFIIVFFYTYTGVLGDNLTVLDIGSFFVAVFISYYFSYKLLYTDFLSSKQYQTVGILIIFLLIFAIIFFTTNPPKIDLFLDPLTNTYGV